MVDITIDGIDIKASEGKSILEVVQENGGCIPTLCHDPRLEPFGACRLCLVEVEGSRRPLPACATKVNQGMVIKTKTDKLTALRKMALELLLSSHYGDCEAPCKRACPAGIDIQGYVALIADGQFGEAARLIKEELPFPASAGRVCPAFCEKSCRRNLVDEPIAICDLKRFIGDLDLNFNSLPECLSPSGYRVAVVGGGPAGMTAAYYLSLLGHEVTVLEANEKIGGMMRYGIPEYRLPKALLDEELAEVVKLCHEIKYNAVLGRDYTVDSLRKDFHAVFLAVGAQESQKLRIPGEDMEGVFHGINFLWNVASGKEVRLGSRVAVVGGGNTAIDCARTAVRLGAQEVFILYRRSEQEMPANVEEVTEARKEGVIFQFLVNPIKLIGKDGKLSGCECVKMVLEEPDGSGRRRPVPVPGSEFQIEVDSLICAAGQGVDTSCLCAEDNHKLLAKNIIHADSYTQKTYLEGVFAGGDCTSGPATVVEAIAAGKRAALAINQFLLGGNSELPLKCYDHSKGELAAIDREEYANYPKIPRTRKVVLEAGKRRNDFREMSATFTKEMAQKEAMRCLSCGCMKSFDCKLRELATEYGAQQDRFAGEKKAHFIDDNHPYIVRDSHKCILCGLCVRICSEVQGIAAFGFVGMGFHTLIEPSLGMHLEETMCESCGQCLSVCPTGALTARTYLPKPIPWKGKKVSTVCPHCSVNCALELKIVEKKIIGASSPVVNTINEGNLCKKAAFDFDFIHGKDRIIKPLIKKGGRLVEASWTEAISAACLGLSKIRDHLGGEALAVLASPNLTNEENYLIQKLARMALHTNNVASTYPMSIENLTHFNCSLEELDKADLVVSYMCDPAMDYPVVANKLRKLHAGGTDLIFAGSHITRFDKKAKMSLKVNADEAKLFLAGVLNYLLLYDFINLDDIKITSDMKNLLSWIKSYPFFEFEELFRIRTVKLFEFVRLYLRARNPVIIVNAGEIDSVEFKLLNLFKQVKSNDENYAASIFTFYPFGNLYGQVAMGVNPDLLPGFTRLSDVAERDIQFWGKALPEKEEKKNIIDELKSGNLMGQITVVNDGINLEGLIRDDIFSVVITPLLSREISRANVILPGATFAETQGNFMDCKGRKVTLNRVLSPPGGKENYRIIAELGTSLGYMMDYNDITDLQKEISDFITRDNQIGNSGMLLQENGCR